MSTRLRYQHVSFDLIEYQDVDGCKLSKKACPRAEKLPGSGICRYQSAMFFGAFNDSWKSVRGFVAQIGNIDHTDSECFIVKILNR